MSDRSRDILLRNDTFGEILRAGKVIGSRATDGSLRGGADVESVLSVDRDGLLIEPLITPGWARAGVTYGPFKRRNGLAFAAFILNGHNSAQDGPLGEPFSGRLKRWLLGCSSRHQSRLDVAIGMVVGVGTRVMKQRGKIPRRFKWWRVLAATSATTQRDNLAVGWFSAENPTEPLSSGQAFVMRAAGEENGELNVKAGPRMQPVVSGVQNLPIFYVVVLREKGAAYYAASVTNAREFAGYPHLRPLAIDPDGGVEPVYPGLFQSVMGEVGFRSNTRVYGARVAQLAGYRHWYGSAHAADKLTGARGSKPRAEAGGPWQEHWGTFTRGAGGITPSGKCLALLRPGAPSGLIHVLTERHGDKSCAGLVWRALDEQNHWLLSVDGGECRISLVENSVVIFAAADCDYKADANARRALQVLDDGQSMRCFLDGRLLFGGAIKDGRFANHDGVGISACGDVSLRSFEAHPRTVVLPEILDLGAPWSRSGETVVDRDALTGNGEDLAGSVVANTGKRWLRSLGEGAFYRKAGGAQVAACLERPNPGRTLYTIGWHHPNFADLGVSITPPGSRRGEGHMGRGGLVCWQDPGNYLVVSVWLDDVFNGAASVSSFFRLGGQEEIYDAVWTNVGRRIQWGVPFDLRLQFDGMHYQVSIDDEPVLYRALGDVYQNAKRLDIRRVGLAANWEWGDDTGTLFKDFVSRV